MSLRLCAGWGLALASLSLYSGCSSTAAQKPVYRFPYASPAAEPVAVMADILHLPIAVEADWFRDYRAAELFAKLGEVRFHTDFLEETTVFSRTRSFLDHRCTYYFSDPVPINRYSSREADHIYTADTEANEMLAGLLGSLCRAIDEGKWTEDPFYHPTQPSPQTRIQRFTALCTFWLALKPTPGVDAILGPADRQQNGFLRIGACNVGPDETDARPALVLFNGRNLTEVLLLEGPEAAALLSRLSALYDRIQELAEERR